MFYLRDTTYYLIFNELWRTLEKWFAKSRNILVIIPFLVPFKVHRNARQSIVNYASDIEKNYNFLASHFLAASL